jgi:2-polyprenyl-6-methoxyphenol hydroxylase-like FAD-dependent oxidoreductase
MDGLTAEVLVIGGGPAGCALGINLARIGRPVIILEQATHPRIPAGESLPPHAVPRLARLAARGSSARF